MGRKFPGYENGLRPEFGFLRDKAVIVQAWKKAHEYIRRHNWYSDTLELDVSCIRLEHLFEEVLALFPENGELKYRPDSMRIVPAPKSSGGWSVQGSALKNDNPDELGIRPLAHLSIRDQTVSMMLLMCLANIIENRQGQPVKFGRKVQNPAVSYGNRLLCSWDCEEKTGRPLGGGTFLWGNAETYDRYYNDYQAFISRPGDFLGQKERDDRLVYYTVTLDLSRCYDRVRRDVLLRKIRRECSADKQDERFFEALKRSFQWRWSADDLSMARQYQESLVGTERKDERWLKGRDGIPQGLVAGGFYANIYLLELDDAIKKVIEDELWFVWGESRVRVLDYCRYVDDMRLVIVCDKKNPQKIPEQGLKSDVCKWAQTLLDKHAEGQKINEEKVKVVQFDWTNARSFAEEQIVEIKDCASGPMDAKSAWELIRMNRALWPCGERDSADGPLNIDGLVIPGEISKIKDETLERFVAYNWRRSYNRLSRFLLSGKDGKEGDRDVLALPGTLTSLDHQTDVFCNQIFRRWTKDPSKMRILRIALDMRPHPLKAKVIIHLALGLVREGGKCRLYGYYVLSELYRAAVTETGFSRTRSDHQDRLKAYRDELRRGWLDIVEDENDLPWYLANQLVMFAVVFDGSLPVAKLAPLVSPLYGRFADLCANKGIQGTPSSVSSPELVLAYLLRRDVKLLAPYAAAITKLVRSEEDCSDRRMWLDFLRPDDLAAVFKMVGESQENLEIKYLVAGARYNLRDLIQSDENPFTNEVSVLRLAMALCKLLKRHKISRMDFPTPENLEVTSADWRGLGDAEKDVHVSVKMFKGTSHALDPLFRPEEWEQKEFMKCAQIGRILRAVIVGGDEFSRMFGIPLEVCGHEDDEQTVYRYSGARTSVLKRRYGLYFDRAAMGGVSIPYSPWLTSLLSSLLSWPGSWCDPKFEDMGFDDLCDECQQRMRILRDCNRNANGCRFIPVDVDLGRFNDGEEEGKLNVAIVQNIYPKWLDFERDPLINDPARRSAAEGHLSDLIQMLMQNFEARRNVIEKYKSVNLVVFPEIAVLPSDVPVLERFADHMNCIVFCGLIFPSHPFDPKGRINAGLWIIPQRSMVKCQDRRTFIELLQGKENLTQFEQDKKIMPFRPVQWLVRGVKNGKKVWTLSASICYDATDIMLLAAMRDKVDCFIVSSSNQDVNVYDSMTAAMRYHLYGHVVVANCGEFGGSTIQAPYRRDYERVIVHSHGKEQAVISLTTLHLRDFIRKRMRQRKRNSAYEPKASPAGYKGRHKGV